MFALLKKRRRARLRAQPFPPEWERVLERNVPVYARIPAELRTQLHGHIQVLLAEKNFEGCDGLVDAAVQVRPEDDHRSE